MTNFMIMEAVTNASVLHGMWFFFILLIKKSWWILLSMKKIMCSFLNCVVQQGREIIWSNYRIGVKYFTCQLLLSRGEICLNGINISFSAYCLLHEYLQPVMVRNNRRVCSVQPVPFYVSQSEAKSGHLGCCVIASRRSSNRSASD